jgi:hypothetical protein
MTRLLLACILLLGLPSRAPAQTWVDLGGGIAGVQGVPSLQGVGHLSPGTSGELDITQAAPFAPALLFFSLVQVGVPFKGGTLEAYPPIAQFLFAIGPTGLSLPWTNWPGGLPAGLDMYFQVAVQDAAAAKGVALSNLLRGTTQP